MVNLLQIPSFTEVQWPTSLTFDDNKFFSTELNLSFPSTEEIIQFLINKIEIGSFFSQKNSIFNRDKLIDKSDVTLDVSIPYALTGFLVAEIGGLLIDGYLSDSGGLASAIFIYSPFNFISQEVAMISAILIYGIIGVGLGIGAYYLHPSTKNS